MNKTVFLDRLDGLIRTLPYEERRATLDYYTEMIEDLIEEGKTEEEAVAALGEAEALAEQILKTAEIQGTETETDTDSKPEQQKKNKMSAGTIVLLVAGSPLWISLAVSALAIILSLYIVLWSLVITVWAVELALGAGALVTLLSPLLLISGRAGEMLLLCGGGLVCAGLAILWFYVSKWASIGAWKLSVWGVRMLMKPWRRKEQNDE